jgi:putative membrane protein
MIRSSSRVGVVKALGVLLWMLRYDLLAVVIVAAIMAVLADKVAFQGAATIVPLLGVVVSIFIGFRNSNAYNRWWEARTLWGTVVGNCRAISNALIAVDDCSDEMAVVVDRMRRRQVRHAWRLAAELRGVAPVAGVAELTPEDPVDASTGTLLALQATDVRDLVRADRIDRQGRVILTNLNTAQALAAGGLERIRNQPIPLPYAVFVRALAWFFGIMVCTRLDNSGHDTVLGIIVGVLIMTLFIVAERLGHFIEEPMSNTSFYLPMNRFCAGITADLLGPDHPLARPADGAHAVVWM